VLAIHAGIVTSPSKNVPAPLPNCQPNCLCHKGVTALQPAFKAQGLRAKGGAEQRANGYRTYTERVPVADTVCDCCYVPVCP